MRARLAVVVLVALAGGCTSMRLSGVVSDKKTGAPIMGAGVAVPDKWTTTGPDGRYSIKTNWAATTVNVNATGYLPASQAVDPGDERYPTLNVQLSRDPSWGSHRE